MNAVSPAFAESALTSTGADLPSAAADYLAMENEYQPLAEVMDGDLSPDERKAWTAACSRVLDKGTEPFFLLCRNPGMTWQGVQAKARVLDLLVGRDAHREVEDISTEALTRSIVNDILAGSIEQDADAELLALRPEYHRLKAEYDAYDAGTLEAAPGQDCGKPFDDLCMTIVSMPAARTDEGRAFKAAAAAHQLVYTTGSSEITAEDGTGIWAAWQLFSQLTAGQFEMPGAGGVA